MRREGARKRIAVLGVDHAGEPVDGLDKLDDPFTGGGERLLTVPPVIG